MIHHSKVVLRSFFAKTIYHTWLFFKSGHFLFILRWEVLCQILCVNGCLIIVLQNKGPIEHDTLIQYCFDVGPAS